MRCVVRQWNMFLKRFRRQKYTQFFGMSRVAANIPPIQDRTRSTGALHGRTRRTRDSVSDVHHWHAQQAPVVLLYDPYAVWLSVSLALNDTAASVTHAYFHFIPGQITFAYTAPPTRLLIQWWEYDSPPQLGERRSTAARAEARGRSHFKYSRSDLLSDQFIGLRIYYIGHLAGSECKIVNK